jgi:long-subunit acyl-CoA synthetase (AMP-forming)
VNWFETIGITVLEGYGMSEDTIISHFNIATDNRVGTVGKGRCRRKRENISVKFVSKISA